MSVKVKRRQGDREIRLRKNEKKTMGTEHVASKDKEGEQTNENR